MRFRNARRCWWRWLGWGIVVMMLALCGVVVVLSWSWETQQREKTLVQIQQEQAQLVTVMRDLEQIIIAQCDANNELRQAVFLPLQQCDALLMNDEMEADDNAPEEIALAALLEVVTIFLTERPDHLAVREMLVSDAFADVESAEITPDVFATVPQNAALKAYLAAHKIEFFTLTQGEDDRQQWELRQPGVRRLVIEWDDVEQSLVVLVPQSEVRLKLNTLSARVAAWHEQQKTAQRADVLATLADVEVLPDQRFTTQDYYVVALLGRSGANVDTIILAVIDHPRERITLFSMPRDLWVDDRKINNLFARYGLQHFLQKIGNLTGLVVDAYVMVDMLAFPKVVDALGGIDYTFEQPLIDPTYRTIDRDGNEGTLFFAAGEYRLNGIEALRVARSRYTSSDFSRAGRQQQLLQSLQQEALQLDQLGNLLTVVPLVFQHTSTDVSPVEALQIFAQTKSYAVRGGNVMSTANILQAEVKERDNGGRVYMLQPVDEDWKLLRKWVWQQIGRG